MLQKQGRLGTWVWSNMIMWAALSFIICLIVYFFVAFFIVSLLCLFSFSCICLITCLHVSLSLCCYWLFVVCILDDSDDERGSFKNWISSQRAEISLGSNLPGSLKWWCAIILLTYAPTTFWIFTQSIDAIDVTIVTLSCLNSINTINIKRCWIADWMLNVQMLQCSNVGGVYDKESANGSIWF